jgi:Domain of Unknown Function with PDB structure (DUF3857)
MKTLCSFLSMLLLPVLLSAQDGGWQASPALHKVNTLFAGESAVILSDKRSHEYIKDEKNGMMVMVTNQKLIKVNDDKGVEMYNKIYIPLSPGAEIVEIKARTIQPNGKVVDLPASKILDAEEDGRLYKKFALEGVEKGSEIEYFYKLKKGLYFFGLEVFQSPSTPCQEAVFSLSYPDFLGFTVKGYNGMTIVSDTVSNQQHTWVAVSKDIAAVPDEKYGESGPYAKNVQYKLSYNLSKDKNVRMFTWNELAKNVYGNYTGLTEKEDKAVDGFLKQTGIQETAAEEEKIIALEDYLKTTINADKDGIGEDAGKVDRIVKTKIASNDGFNKLFAACLEKLKINWQIVFPSKRDDLPLDETLENFRLIDEPLFYFPSTGNFLAPSSSTFRYPYIPPYWAATKGLFLKGTTIGTFKTALASFGNIPVQPFEKSAHNMDITIQFNTSLDSVTVHSKQILLGYGASFYRPAYNFTPKDKLEDLSKDIIRAVAKSDNIKNIKVENMAMTDGAKNKPLTIEADIVSADLLEVAGNRLLLKIGEVIGPQEQMYQEKPRQLPIAIQYPHALDREITFTVPDGYRIKNLADLEMNITDKNTGKETMGFISSYALNGNLLKIKVQEFYKATSYPLNMFEEFKKVINASADFNKVVLILEKK